LIQNNPKIVLNIVSLFEIRELIPQKVAPPSSSCNEISPNFDPFGAWFVKGLSLFWLRIGKGD